MAEKKSMLPQGNGNFFDSFAINLRVIYAILLREIITRYGRHNIGVFWLVIEPMMFTLGVAGLWTLVGMHKNSIIPIYVMALTGYSCVLMWRNSVSRCISAVEANENLLFHRNVKVLDLLIARVFLEILGATASFMFLACVFMSFGVMQTPKDMLILVGGWLLLCWFSFALAFIMGALAAQTELIDRVWHVFTYLFFPLSGAAYMVDWLPVAAQKYALLLPMVNCTEMIRHGYLGDAIPTYENIPYVITVNLVMSMLGLMLIKKTEREVRKGN